MSFIFEVLNLNPPRIQALSNVIILQLYHAFGLDVLRDEILRRMRESTLRIKDEPKFHLVSKIQNPPPLHERKTMPISRGAGPNTGLVHLRISNEAFCFVRVLISFVDGSSGKTLVYNLNKW
eukprot:PhF_6_TR40258/c0_g1_i1/m.59952